MKRILLMVIRNLIFVPYWWIKLCWYAAHTDDYPEAEKYAFLRYVDDHAIKGGNIHIDVHGQENIPRENGFMFFPNHQGLFDVLLICDTHKNPTSFVIRNDLANVPLLKQTIKALDAKAIDRDDPRQGMQIIKEMTEGIKQGRNYIIFPEGTRSKNGNVPGNFKGGSFKSAYKAKAPIVPVALIDSFKPFDIKDTKTVKVQIHYLKPLYYEDYKDMKTTEIAELVKSMIVKTIEEKLS